MNRKQKQPFMDEMKSNAVLSRARYGAGALARTVTAPIRIPVARYRERRNPGIRYVSDSAEWAILREGEGIIGHLNEILPGLSAAIVPAGTELFHKVVHFGSHWGFFNNIESVDASNQVVTSVFHWDETATAANKDAMDVLQRNRDRVGAIVTASTIMETRLRSWGMPADKLRRIPIGADTRVFRPATAEQRRTHRRRLAVPDNAVCIGSFQKDGVGWDEGMEPKMIKGPDVFIEVVRRLSKDHPVFVLLAGPARGYVRHRLETDDIPYHHAMVDHPHDLVPFYQALDFYLMTSREEGGPKALPESMASGVPLVSTRVGMAPDMIVDGENGLLAEIDDVAGLVAQAERLIGSSTLRDRMIGKALRTVEGYHVANLAERHWREVYEPLMERL